MDVQDSGCDIISVVFLELYGKLRKTTKNMNRLNLYFSQEMRYGLSRLYHIVRWG
jgi:hypothetical protein